MSQEDTLRLAAEIVDKWSGPLRDMTKGLHQMQDLLKGTHTAGSKGAKEQAEQHKLLNEQIVASGRAVSGVLTPAMGALGLSVGGAGASIAALIGQLKAAGDSFYKIQDATRRTGLSAADLQVYVRTLQELGVPAERAREALSGLGDIAARLGRQNSPQIQALESQFHNLHGLITKMSGESGADAIKTFWDFYLTHPAPPDQQRKLLEAFNLPTEMAAATFPQLKAELERQQKYTAAHPPISAETMKALKESFADLRGEVDGLGQDFVNAFGGEGADLVKELGEAIHHNVEDIKVMIQDWKNFAGWLGTIKEKLGFSPEQIDPSKRLPEPGTMQRPFPEPPADKFSPASRLAAGMSPISFTTGGDAETMFSRGVKTGTLAALREWSASISSSTAPAGGGGVINASLGGGGGGRSWGGGGYSQLPNDATDGAGAGGKPMPGGAGLSPSGTTPGQGAGLSGSAYLQAERSRYAKEFAANPALKERLAALIDLENPKAGTAVAESLMNRMNLAHHSIESGMGGGRHSFYGPVRHGLVDPRLRELQRNPKRLSERMAQIDAALGGSNFTKGYTDQGSRGDPNYERGGVGVNINGERFNDWGVAGARAYREHQQAMVASGGQRDLLTNDASARAAPQKVEGGADLRVAFENAPSGTRAYLKSHGIFADGGKVDWGHAMSSSDPGGAR